MTGARQLHDALAQVAEITDNYTARGSHDGCGECCGRFLPMFPWEAVVVRSAARKVDVRPEDGPLDLTCPLLTADRRCAVYGSRPTVCRAFDCQRLSGAGCLEAARHGLEHGMMPGMEIYDMREVIGWDT